jgi:hypothetical protein
LARLKQGRPKIRAASIEVTVEAHHLVSRIQQHGGHHRAPVAGHIVVVVVVCVHCADGRDRGVGVSDLTT